MNHKLLLVLLGALTTGVVSTQGQTATAAAPAPAAPAPSWTVTASGVSQYMFRGVRYGGPSFQPSVEYASGPLTAGLWANLPVSDKVAGTSDPEIDLYGSYTETINDTLNFATGLTLYTYPRAEKSNGFYSYTVEPSLAVNYTIGGLKLTPKLYYDFMLHGPTYELNAAIAMPLKDLGTELRFTGTVGTFKWTDSIENGAPEIKNYGDYWQAGVAAPFQINSRSTLTIGWSYAEGKKNFIKQGTLPKVANPAAIGRGVVTVSYAMTF